MERTFLSFLLSASDTVSLILGMYFKLISVVGVVVYVEQEL